MIFGGKKSGGATRSRRAGTELGAAAGEQGLIRFRNVTLPPAISNLSLEIPGGTWALLHGEDDFAKALFCDLCFSYIQPEGGQVSPALKGGDVSFLGRSNTTYGRTLFNHLSCGVRQSSLELTEFAVTRVLSPRFRRHLAADLFEFRDGRSAAEAGLDERDFLEIAEANAVLQRRRAAVIDTTSDFYRLAVGQGFRHSEAFLSSGQTLIWILDDRRPLPSDARCWNHQADKALSLSFPTAARAGHLN